MNILSVSSVTRLTKIYIKSKAKSKSMIHITIQESLLHLQTIHIYKFIYIFISTLSPYLVAIINMLIPGGVENVIIVTNASTTSYIFI